VAGGIAAPGHPTPSSARSLLPRRSTGLGCLLLCQAGPPGLRPCARRGAGWSPPLVRQVLEDWIRERAKRVPDGERAFFLGRGGRRLSKRSVDDVVRGLGNDAGVTLSAHLLRHTFLTNLTEQLAAVERAEARLAAGTYGLSVDSGDPIPDERLEALPTAERTVREQELRGR